MVKDNYVFPLLMDWYTCVNCYLRLPYLGELYSRIYDRLPCAIYLEKGQMAIQAYMIFACLCGSCTLERNQDSNVWRSN